MGADGGGRRAVGVVDGVGEGRAGVDRGLAGHSPGVNTGDFGAEAIDVDAAEVAIERATRGDDGQLDLVAHSEPSVAGRDVDQLPVGPLHGVAGEHAGGVLPRHARLAGCVKIGIQLGTFGQIVELDEVVGLLVVGVGRILKNGGQRKTHVNNAVESVDVGRVDRDRLRHRVGVLVLAVDRRVEVVHPGGANVKSGEAERLTDAKVWIKLALCSATHNKGLGHAGTRRT